jgi:hypothetical protein
MRTIRERPSSPSISTTKRIHRSNGIGVGGPNAPRH